MLKALFKKEFLELNTMYFMNAKTKKRRSTLGIIGYILLFVFVFISCAISFVGIDMLFGDAFVVGANKAWLYFAIAAITSIFISSFINMFIANSYLFNAKDNELLLSMPIKPCYILLTRMLGLYVWGLLYLAITFLPAIGVYWYLIGFSFTSVFYPILAFVISSFLVLAISSGLGWIVAFVSSRLRNKTVSTIALSLVLIAVYYFCYFKMNEALQTVITDVTKTEATVKGLFYPFYYFGLMCEGNLIATLISVIAIACIFALAYYLLSKNFINIVTRNKGQKKVVYKEETVTKVNSLSSLLIKKELKHFTSSVAYLMNIGLGYLIMIISAVVLFIKIKPMTPMIDSLKDVLPELYILLPSIVVAMGCLVGSMCCYTAPSISLEGKNFWIIKSMPIDYKEFLFSKIKTHMLLISVPSITFSVLCSLALNLDLPTIAMNTVTILAFDYLSASIGLFLNLKKPNFEWSNETYVVKQSGPVAISLFGGWGVIILYGVASYFLSAYVEPFYITLGFLIICVYVSRFLTRFFVTKGVKIIDNL